MINVGSSSIEKLISRLEETFFPAEDAEGRGVPRGRREMELHSAAMFLSADLTAAVIFGLRSSVFEDGKDSGFYRSARDLNTPASMIKVSTGLAV